MSAVGAGPRMGIYLVERKKDAGWDTYRGFVVYARDPLQARRVAAGADKDNAKIWMEPKHSTIRLLGTSDRRKTMGLILADFLAG